MLKLSVELSFRDLRDLGIKPFDQAVLAAVLRRADELTGAEPDATFAFCERDGDLQP
ncbi:hypothetical protein ACOQFB_01115 [Anaeromyxobacter sp. Red801]|uniref:hypothetical protein n=1 Tax=Anaeromyxobacter sp. Red801 TaxID=3411632 RepID=UPI003BA16DDD